MDYPIRVKVSSHRNFVCTEVQTINHHNNSYQHNNHKGQATINPQRAVVLRHGKVCHTIRYATPAAHDNVLFFYVVLQVSANEYVLDFRDPLTPLVGDLFPPLPCATVPSSKQQTHCRLVVIPDCLFVCICVSAGCVLCRPRDQTPRGHRAHTSLDYHVNGDGSSSNDGNISDDDNGESGKR